jgi:hypothetical protein
VLETSTLEQLIFKHSISAAFICRNRHCSECFPSTPVTSNSRAPQRN